MRWSLFTFPDKPTDIQQGVIKTLKDSGYPTEKGSTKHYCMSKNQIDSITAEYVTDPINDGRDYPIWAGQGAEYVEYWAYCD